MFTLWYPENTEISYLILRFIVHLGFYTRYVLVLPWTLKISPREAQNVSGLRDNATSPYCFIYISARFYETCFMLNSGKHEILNAN